MANILVLDADHELADLLCFALEQGRISAVCARSHADALRLLAEEEIALIIADADFNGRDCAGLVRALRRQNPGAVILLIGRGDEDARVLGLDAGADSYLSKPFSPRELVARVRAELRRRGQEPQPTSFASVLELGPLTLHPRSHLAYSNGVPLHLTSTEFRLLECLMTHAEVVVPTPSLLRKVWGIADPSGVRLVYTAIWRLRRRLTDAGAEPDLLQTVPGTGFILSASPRPMLAASGL